MNVRNISAWSINHPVPVIVLFLVMTIGGMVAFYKVGIDESPNIDVPIVNIGVQQTGAAPSELETQVTQRIEDAVAGLGNIKHISSVIGEGQSSTTIEFELDTDIDRATNDVRNEIAKIRTMLPREIDEPIVQRVDFTGGPFVTYIVSSPRRTTEELSWMIDNTISRSLMAAKGVGQVQRSGGVDREIRVDLDPYRLQAVGATAEMVSNQVRMSNINLPGGRGEVGTQEQTIRTLGSAPSASELADLRIALPGKRWVRLDSLGKIEDRSSDQRQIALYDGKPVVAFSIVRSTGSNMVDVEHNVEEALKKLEKTLPPDIKIERIRSQTKFVHDSYHAAMESLWIGGALAVFVVWLFLRDWRAAVISSLAMPLSLIPTFAVMQAAGFTLNNMSLLGLALVIGVLVDDAIVEIENIVRHINMGKSPFQAAFDAADEIGLAVVATTMTIIVVFIPVAFMGGIPGKFLKQFGLTVAASVFFSLVVARMLTPLIAAYFMKVVKHTEHRDWMTDLYDRMLAWALKHRIMTIVAGVLFFVASIMLFRTMPTSVIGNVDRGETMLSMELPPGSTLADTRHVAEQATEIFLARPEVTSVFAQIGTASARRGRQAGSLGDINKGSLYVTLKPRGERKLSQQQFEQSVRQQLLVIPGARMSFGTTQGISGKLKVLLTSDDHAALDRTATALEDQIRTIPGLSDIVSSASLKKPEIQVKPDFARAAEQGISVQTIARTAMVATLGDIDANLPKFNLENRQINIRVQLDPKYRLDPQIISELRVARSDGKLVPLSSVATINYGSGHSEVKRYDRARQVTIEASLAPNFTLGQALAQVRKLPAYKEMPPTIKDVPAGDAEIQKDIFSGFAWALGTGVFLIYGVLVLLFGGFVHPLTIMMSLPLSLGGALVALVMGHQSLGFYALIGIVMLMGLVTKNAILLVEYCIMAMKSGVPRDEAITMSGEARMRPILMTTVAMIAGMLPIAFGIGAGSEARAPMAIAVTGGLVTSTLLTLIIVPVVFTYMDDFQKFLVRQIKGRLNEEKLETPAGSEEADLVVKH
jgi:hydrophobic/amphiphilic exporter-1 (mainly G- bacteria), HAE1 family